MNKFCTNCGSQISFSANNPPKFCSSCGTPLDGGERPIENSQEPMEETKASIPKNFKLAYEISVSEGPRPMNEILKEQKLGIGKIPRKPMKGNPLERIINECKPARESTDVG